jgi:hypothetical protein
MTTFNTETLSLLPDDDNDAKARESLRGLNISVSS